MLPDNGNFILDVDFGALEKDFSPELLAEVCGTVTVSY